MISKRVLPLICAAILMVSAMPAASHEEGGSVAALKAEVLRSVEEAETKLNALAEAVPQEKFGWGPSPEVRSFSQVLMHVAGGNYFLAGMVGPAPEGGRPKELEKITDRAAVLAALKKSFDYTRANLNALAAADMGAEVEAPWGKTSKRSILLALATHAHEHLGQAIAYTRSMGVVPPWSKKAE